MYLNLYLCFVVVVCCHVLSQTVTLTMRQILTFDKKNQSHATRMVIMVVNLFLHIEKETSLRIKLAFVLSLFTN